MTLDDCALFESLNLILSSTMALEVEQVASFFVQGSRNEKTYKIELENIFLIYYLTSKCKMSYIIMKKIVLPKKFQLLMK